MEKEHDRYGDNLSSRKLVLCQRRVYESAASTLCLARVDTDPQMFLNVLEFEYFILSTPECSGIDDIVLEYS